MAKSEELSPLLAAKQLDGEAAGHGDGSQAAAKPVAGSGWTAEGLPLARGSFLGDPVGRAHWDSGLFTCLGRSDEFCSSDLEVCSSPATTSSQAIPAEAASLPVRIMNSSTRGRFTCYGP